MESPVSAPALGPRWAAVAVVLVAFALRVCGLAAFPPGLYRDEALNGLDAVGVLAGDHPVYFPANNGREPMYIYLAAGTIGLLGRSPVAERLPAVAAGTLLAAAVYALGALLWRRRAGLLAAALLAVAPWPVLLGRIGLRVGLLPAVMTLAAAATWRGWRRRHSAAGRLWLVLGGALAGACLYTYVAARVLVVLAPLALGAAVWRGRRQARSAVTAAGLWLATAFVIALPLGVAGARDPATVLGRPGQVALWSRAEGGVPAALARSAVATAGMFTVRGDTILRHNIPGRPLFGLLAGGLFLLGVIGLGARARRPESQLVLAWLVFMALPTLLAEDAPHFLRAAGVLPAAALAAAYGADVALAGAAWVARGRRRGATPAWAAGAWALLALLAVFGELVPTARLLHGPEVAKRSLLFEAGATELAVAANGALGGGWQGGWTAIPYDDGRASGHVWLDRRLRDGWAAVRFLVPEERVTLTDPYDPVLSEAGVAFLWPYDLDKERVWGELANDLTLTVTPGPLEQGDLATGPELLYVRVDGVRVDGAVRPPGEPVATFANGLELALPGGSSGRGAPNRSPYTNGLFDTGGGASAGAGGGGAGAGAEGGAGDAAVWPGLPPDTVIVETEWHVTRPLTTTPTLFVHELVDSKKVDSVDAPLGFGLHPFDRMPEELLPPTLWPAGLRVVERRVVRDVGRGDAPHAGLALGLYTLGPGDTLVPVAVTSAPGAAEATATEVTVPWPFRPPPARE